MNVSLNQNEINEASLLIEIERFILTTLDATRQPRSFYETFTDLLLDFDQV
ncbi:YagK/YfjJ domain-containing protein, partial [Acinetobacter baumannii]